MKKATKAISVISMIVVAFGILTISGSALPATYINDGVEDAVGGTDAKKIFEGTQLWIGNEMDLTEMAAVGKVGVSSKTNPNTKEYIIDGKQSIFAINYKNNSKSGAPMKEWCNIWMTHDSSFGLKNSSTYVISFVMRTYTPWQPEPVGGAEMQNFGIVSIRNYRYKGGASLADFFIQPNITSEGVTSDQMIRVADFATPPNPKNTMSVKKLDNNTFSVVCKFVTSVPTTDVDNGNDHWFATFTFHGPGIIACDNIKVYKSDLVLSSFHQKVGSVTTSATRTSNNVTSGKQSGTTASPSGTKDTETDSSITEGSQSGTNVVSGSESQVSTSIISSSDTTKDGDVNTKPEKILNLGATVALIAGIVVVIAGAGVACYFFIIKKKI